MEKTDLVDAHLAGADFTNANMQRAIMTFAHLQAANFSGAQLQDANLSDTQAQVVNFSGAQLQGTSLSDAELQGANFSEALLQGANFHRAHLEETIFFHAQMQKTIMSFVHMEDAELSGVDLESAILTGAHLEGAGFGGARLHGVNLQGAWLDSKTDLTEVEFDAKVQLADVFWNGVSLKRANWDQVARLGDEDEARRLKPRDDEKQYGQPLKKYQAAKSAYAQLAVALRSQGLNDVADRFTYRAQLLQRVVFRLQRHWLKYLFSWFLYLLTGYGFRMWRIIVAYTLLILLFALAYWSFGVHHPHDISFWTAIIVSVTAFHGRVFSNPFTPDVPDAQVIITAIEAVCGLVVEGLFVAMLVQRFFSR